MYNIRKYIVVLLCALAGFSGSCSLPGWNSNLKDFIETGLSVVYLDTSSYRRASGDIGDDARSGEEVTVFVYLNNPKSLDLVYTLEAGSGLVASGASAPGGTAGADNQRTFVSFTFIPSESAEHGEIPFTLGLRSPSITEISIRPALASAATALRESSRTSQAALHRKKKRPSASLFLKTT